jgi:hypothetical protein
MSQAPDIEAADAAALPAKRDARWSTGSMYHVVSRSRSGSSRTKPRMWLTGSPPKREGTPEVRRSQAARRVG